MPTDRIKLLHKYHEEDPDDPFNLYALALEYLNADPAKSLELFETLLDRHPDYLPTYYHAAKLHQENGHKENAIQIYQRGIELAKRSSDAKAVRELRSAYDELMFE